jgi:hypothetical protein
MASDSRLAANFVVWQDRAGHAWTALVENPAGSRQYRVQDCKVRIRLAG